MTLGRGFQVFGIVFVACAWALNMFMTLHSILVSKTLLQPKPKRTEDFCNYHGLHQGGVVEDAHICRPVQAGDRDLETGSNIPVKRYEKEFSNGA
jgi:hypothetical protein